MSGSALLVDRLMLGALAAVVASHYLVTFGETVIGVTTPTLVGDSGPMALALAIIVIVWWLQREGRSLREHTVAQALGASVVVLLLLVLCGTIAALLWPTHAIAVFTRSPSVLSFATACGFALSALGSVESLSQAALDLEQPRIRNLRRVVRLVSGYGIVVTAGLAFLFVALVGDERIWSTAPLAGVAYHLVASAWVRPVLVSLVTAAAAVFLAATLRSTAIGAHGVLARLVDEGVLDDGWRALHHRFGTPWRSIDAVATAQVAVVLVSGGNASWIARAYADCRRRHGGSQAGGPGAIPRDPNREARLPRAAQYQDRWPRAAARADWRGGSARDRGRRPFAHRSIRPRSRASRWSARSPSR